MTRDVPIDAVRGRVVVAWHTDEGGLFLRLKREDEDLRLVCRCGRSHWIVREHFAPEAASLAVTCHGCGTRGTFSLEEVRPSHS
jgi:hypothetical protein